MASSGPVAGRRLDRELDRELASHLDEAAEELERQGFSPDEARRQARLHFGSTTGVREASRDVQTFPAIDHLTRDVRLAARGLRRSPGFALAVAGILSIGTGAVTAVFVLLHAIVIRPLPFPAADRLVAVRSAAPGLGLAAAGLSAPLYFQYADRARTFESIALYQDRDLLNLRLADSSERVHVTLASAALFKLLEVRPALGRLFTVEDGRPGFMNATWQIPILLSHRFWTQRFGGDRGILGRVLTINDSPREVVGVLPETFTFPTATTDIWMLTEPARSTRNFSWGLSWEAVGKLRPGVGVAAAAADLSQAIRSLEGAYPNTTAEKLAEVRLSPVVIPLKRFVIGDVAPLLWLLFGGMSVLLLAAGANSGGLFLVRAEHRGREIAVRRALGAQGPQLARMFVVEALMLTGFSATLGFLLARGIVAAVIASVPVALPRVSEIRVDAAAAIVAAVMALVMAAFYGALAMRNRQTAGLLAEGARTTAPRRALRSARALLVLQVALALTLMTGAALMVRTYWNLSHRELGFSPAGALTVDIGLPSRKAGAHIGIYQAVVERLRHVAMVESATAASFLPLTTPTDIFPVEAGETPVPFKFVVPGYFDTMGMTIVDGDRIGATDPVTTPSPVLVSAALARRLFPGERAVGRTVRRLERDGSLVTMGRERDAVPPFTIAGIVGDTREVALRGDPTEIVYIPLIEPRVERSLTPTTMTLVVRTAVPPLSLATAVRAAIAEADPDLSVGTIRTMESIVVAARAREAFVGLLLLAAAAMSLLLGAIGIYASVAQVVRRRTREIGIRRALGASGTEIVRMVIAGSVRTVLIGSASGLCLAIAGSRLLESLLFGVDARDPLVFASVTASLLLAAIAAGLLAARQAARLAPVDALRVE